LDEGFVRFVKKINQNKCKCNTNNSEQEIFKKKKFSLQQFQNNNFHIK
jgi:hypothetical protein